MLPKKRSPIQIFYTGVEMSTEDSHYRVSVEGHKGHWTSPTEMATFFHEGMLYCAGSNQFEGRMPIEQVMTIVPVSHREDGDEDEEEE